MKKIIESYLDTVASNFENLKNSIPEIESAANITIDALKNKNKVISVGMVFGKGYVQKFKYFVSA